MSALSERVYVSGPMTGIPRFNFPAFDAARDALLRQGHHVVSPADMDRERDPDVEIRTGFAQGLIGHDSNLDYVSMLAEDFAAIADSHTIVLLPGWENSRGAKHEKYVAEALDKTVRYAVLEQGKAGHAPTYSFVDAPPKVPGPIIVGLCGYAQVGKDTVGALLVEHYGFTRISFADALRDFLYAVNPVIPALAWEEGVDQNEVRLQTLIDNIGWDAAKVEYPEVRELQQRTGTDAGRVVLGNNIWVDTAMKKIAPPARRIIPDCEPTFVPAASRYVFTDVRFPNEVDAVHAAGGKMVRVDRPGTAPVNGHPSETALDDLGFDCYHIHNTGDLDYLHSRVVWLASMLGV